MCKEALEIKTKHYGKGHIETANTIQNLAVLLMNQGKLEQAKEMCKEALEIKLFLFYTRFIFLFSAQIYVQ